jgi:hypothetical protein
MTENNLFQEVQEDLDRQRLEALWKKYGAWVVIAALGIVVSTASSTAYRSWTADHNQRLTSALLSATQASGDAAKNIEALQAFAGKNAGAGLADLALLRAGALAVDRNDSAKAVELFDKVASDAKADPAFRQLGDLLSVRAQMDKGDPATLSARLQPLTAPSAAWRFSALEDQAYLALRAGDKAKAKQIFADLSQNARAPQSITARAADILRSLNVESR